MLTKRQIENKLEKQGFKNVYSPFLELEGARIGFTVRGELLKEDIGVHAYINVDYFKYEDKVCIDGAVGNIFNDVYKIFKGNPKNLDKYIKECYDAIISKAKVKPKTNSTSKKSSKYEELRNEFDDFCDELDDREYYEDDTYNVISELKLNKKKIFEAFSKKKNTDFRAFLKKVAQLTYVKDEFALASTNSYLIKGNVVYANSKKEAIKKINN